MSNPPFAVDVFYNSLPTYGTGTTTAFVQAHAAGLPVGHGGDVLARSERAHQHLRRADGRADRDHRDHGAAGGDVAAQHRHRLDELPRARSRFPRAVPRPRRADAFRAGHDGRRHVAVRAHARSRRTRSACSPCRWAACGPRARGSTSASHAGAPDAFGRPLATAVTASFMTAPFAAGGGRRLRLRRRRHRREPERRRHDRRRHDRRRHDRYRPADGGTTDTEPADAAQSN